MLPVFYGFQVGPKLSSPTALPWFHILLIIRGGIIRTVRVHIVHNQYNNNPKHQEYKQISVQLRTILVAFTCIRHVINNYFLKLFERCWGYYQGEQQMHQLLVPLQPYARAYLKQSSLHLLFHQISVKITTIHWSYFLHQSIYKLFPWQRGHYKKEQP